MKTLKKATAFLALAIAAALAVLFLDFVNDSTRPQAPVASGADAIVVLTGGRGRTSEGLSQLRKGRGGVLILSGVHQDSDLDSIFLNTVNRVERDRIVLEKRSRSTYENAVEVKKIMDERGLGSMVLITSGYHIKRAHFTFTKVMPGRKIFALSVSSPNFDEARWWDGKGLGLLAAEFVKYHWYRGRFAVSGQKARDWGGSA